MVASQSNFKINNQSETAWPINPVSYLYRFIIITKILQSLRPKIVITNIQAEKSEVLIFVVQNYFKGFSRAKHHRVERLAIESNSMGHLNRRRRLSRYGGLGFVHI